jgi:hypothetical protein
MYIKIFIEEIFPDIVIGLKEDMEAELENMKDHFEEHERQEIEKIRIKYNLRK